MFIYRSTIFHDFCVFLQISYGLFHNFCIIIQVPCSVRACLPRCFPRIRKGECSIRRLPEHGARHWNRLTSVLCNRDSMGKACRDNNPFAKAAPQCIHCVIQTSASVPAFLIMKQVRLHRCPGTPGMNAPDRQCTDRTIPCIVFQKQCIPCLRNFQRALGRIRQWHLPLIPEAHTMPTIPVLWQNMPKSLLLG